MIRKHTIPLYGGQVVVCVSDNPVRALHRADIPAAYTEDEADPILAWVQESPRDAEDVQPGSSRGRWVVVLRPQTTLNILAHEAQHLVNFICKWYGLPTTDEDEPQAYLAGWAVELLAADLART